MHPADPLVRPRTESRETSTEIIRPRATENVHAGSACLVQIYPTERDIGTRYSLTEGQLLIGRAPCCHVRLEDDAVSRFHALITTKNDDYYVTDRRSTNGT